MLDEKHKIEGFVGQKMFVVPKDLMAQQMQHPIGSLLYIKDVGYFPKAKDHTRVRMAGAPEHILIFCVEGSGVVCINDDEVILKPNEFCLIRRGEKHSYHTSKMAPWSIYWMHFDGLKADDVCANIPGHAKITLRGTEKSGRMALFNDIFEVLSTGLGLEQLLYVDMQLWSLLSSFAFSNLYVNAEERSLVKHCISFLGQHLNQSLQLEDIAREARVSPSHISTLFRNQIGHSPINYYIFLKMQKASSLLKSSAMSIKEISFSLGYNDPYYFSRIFKKVMGESPRTYRKNGLD